MTPPTANDPSVIAGRYEVASKLGAGAFGTVYKAKDTMLGRMVAIKTIRLEGLAAQGASVEELVRRFKSEARVSAQLKHPGIVTIYDIGEAQGLSYLAMEFIDGVGLDRVIAGAGRMPIERAAALAAQVADALDFAHRHNVVHRDIKPANIMVEAGDRVKVTDFGIAKVLDAAEQLTATGSLLGTPSYMSPEQARGGAVDGRSDLFAVGCIFYEMLSGQRAFRADSITGLIFKIITEEPKPLREIEPNLPEPVLALVDKALAKTADARFQTGREMAEALLALTTAGAVPTLRTEDMATTAGGLKMEHLPTMPGAMERTQAGDPVATAPPPPPMPKPPLPRPAPGMRPMPAPAHAAPSGGSSKGPLIVLGVIGVAGFALVAAVALFMLRGRNNPAPGPTAVPATTLAQAPVTTLGGPASAGVGGAVGATPTPAPAGTPAPAAVDTNNATAQDPVRTAGGIQPPPTLPVVPPPTQAAAPPAASSFLDLELPDDGGGGRAAGDAVAEAYRGGRSGGYTPRSGGLRQRYPRGLAGAEKGAVLALRHLQLREHDHFRTTGSYGSLRDMGLPVSGNTFERKGYRFELKVAEDGYTLTAVPTGAGGRAFTADDTGAIRPGLE